MMPIYWAIYRGPARSYRRDGDGDPILSRKKYITIHNTSNDATAEGEAAYAKVRTDGTSSHYYCDNDSIVQSLNTDWCAGHVGSYQGNTYGISWEITGVNAWARDTWLANVAWELLARQIAVDCREFGIPARLLTIEQMRGGVAKGFVTHDMCRIAWGGTTHTDPGPGFPMDHLLAKVSAVLNGDDDMEQTDPLIKPTGASRSVGDMYADVQNLRNAFIGDGAVALGPDGQPIPGYPKAGSPLDNMARMPQLLAQHASAPIDPEALAAVVKPLLDAMEARLNARIDAVAAESRDAVADLGEGGAAKVRADQE